MSTDQAVQFASTYSVVAQWNAPNGLSATVFADAAGNTYLAIRGTNDAQDVLTDVVDIALFGTTAFQSQYASLKTKVNEWIGNGALSSSFTVTGHSLGGFLATGIAADFSANVSHAYLYDSPGVGGVIGEVISPILNALGITAPLDSANISNLRADAGISPIAGLGEPVSTPIPIVIEDQTAYDVADPPVARNHSQQVLTDALALYNTFAQLDPALSIEQTGAIVKAANHLNSKTLESALDALRTLLDPAAPQTVTGDRNVFYTNLYALEQSAPFLNLVGQAAIIPLTGMIAADIAATAQNDIAVRYALHALNPFALQGADYSQHNANGVLDLVDCATHTGEMTGQYLADRAAFLERKIWFSTHDKNPVDPGYQYNSTPNTFQNDSTYFEDAASGYKIAQGFAPDTPFPNIRRYYFGDAGSNVFAGGEVEDHLYGGAGGDALKGNGGSDYLEGGKDSDYLEGGQGNDTYAINAGDGFDTILDSDGQGQIKMDSLALSGGGQLGDNRVFRGTDANGNTHLYTFVTGDRAAGGDLIVDGAMLVKGYQSNLGNGMGLILSDAAPVAAPQATLSGTANDDDIVIAMTNTADDVIDAGAGQDYVFAGDGGDVIMGGVGSDALDGFAGNDRIYADNFISVPDAIALGNAQTGTGLPGDALSGDAGNDTIIGGTGNDILSAGAGADLLVAGAGNDYVFGDTDWAAGNGRNWGVVNGALGGGAGGVANWSGNNADVLYAGAGDDRAWGELGNDVLFGEKGSDLLVGGDGNDVILGGDNNDTLYGDFDSIAAEPGSDYLDGGAGNDFIYGNEGGDIIIGGKDNDNLYGGAGQDTYLYNVGDGIDTIYDTKADNNILRFGAGVNKDNIKLRLGSLMLDLGNGDEIHIGDFDRNDAFNSSSIGSFEFDDGTALTTAELLARGFDLDGTAGADAMLGGAGDERKRLRTHAANDETNAWRAAA